MLDDTYFMRIALNEAEDAYAEGEIPVGRWSCWMTESSRRATT